MKVKLTIELDLPEEYRSFSGEELRQVIFDDYVNYARVSHLEDAVKWRCIADKQKTASTKQIFQHHKTWSKICGGVKNFLLDKV